MRCLVIFIILILINSLAAARTTLTGSDLSLIGAFRTPSETSTNFLPAGSNGLALRRVGGQVRLFSASYNPDSGGRYELFEMSVPGTLNTDNSTAYPVAPVVKNWGEVFADRYGKMNGMYWDETDKRLYYSASDDYGPQPGNGETLGFLTFNGDESVATSHGSFYFNDRSYKQVNFGLTAIPSDFATQYLSGKRLGAGFGGNQSMIATGPGSFGPTLTAFSPPSIGSEATPIPNTPLVGYGGSHASWQSGVQPTITRAWRDDDQLLTIYGGTCETNGDPDSSTYQGDGRTEWLLTGDESFCWQGYSASGTSYQGYANYPTYDSSRIRTKHWVPGNSFWTADYLGQAGAWIQTANKEGFLLLPTFSTGLVWYWSSEPKGEGFNHRWYIYSRDQLASVAQGAAEHSIQAARYPADFSAFGVTSRSHSGGPPYICNGMAFDPADNRLYVMLSQAASVPSAYNTNLIIIYQVNDTSSGTRYRLRTQE